MAKHKVLLFANTDWYLYNFRRSLADRLRREGYEVLLVSPPGPYGERLKALGFRWLPFPFSTRSTNPLAELGVIARLWRLYRRERPDLCHHFTSKCVIYGSIAARLAGIGGVVNAVTGLGHVFTDTGLRARLLGPVVRSLYRLALRHHSNRTIFQNAEDLEYFQRRDLVHPERCALIRGSGVDTAHFRPQVPAGPAPGQLKILFASRLLREKGIFEFLEAARRLRQAKKPLEFIVAGELYPDNPSSLGSDDLAAMGAEGLVDYRGQVEDMRALIGECDIIALPSYRDGPPRILLEAAAMEKPIVATDIAGCRGVVVDGQNGLLVPAKEVDALTHALGALAADLALRQCMGKAGRQIVVDNFDEKIVIARTLDVYGAFLPEVGRA